MKHSCFHTRLCFFILMILLLVCEGCRSSTVNVDQDRSSKSIPKKIVHEEKNEILYHYELGRSLLNAGKYKEAISEFTEVLKMNPTIGDARLSRAVAFHKIGKFNDAIKDLDHLIELGLADIPSLNVSLGPRIYLQRGNVYIDKGDIENGMADYDRSIQVSLKLLEQVQNQKSIIDRSPILLKNLMNTYMVRATAYKLLGNTEKEQNDFEQYKKYRQEYEKTQF